jgi:hypothetical protein
MVMRHTFYFGVGKICRHIAGLLNIIAILCNGRSTDSDKFSFSHAADPNKFLLVLCPLDLIE